MIIIAVSTNSLTVEIFEKTLTVGFSGVNTRLAFDLEILLPNFTENDYKKMSVNQSFETFKRKNLKVGFKLKLDGEKYY